MGGVLAGRSPALLGLIEPKGRVSMMDFPSQKKKKKVRSMNKTHRRTNNTPSKGEKLH
jgi:hypothetical protein